ncbi:nucleoside triphosphate pyrophosphatase [Thiomicrorhabdus sp.]|uniref:Maf family protein n=1 Tax=Thiomicrorhabdus sp. TaxID=2039724 RepID=UPI0029C6CB36|nr:nucleoside triphosphate pyrophosphatase [Thiomicrorhabdus sp.]
MAEKLYLASSSPRRQELLQQMGLTFQLVQAPVEEVALPNESPFSFVRRIAIEKALDGFNKIEGKDCWVIGGDTAVVLNNKVLGKPRHMTDATTMLRKLSGTTHEVLSAVAVVYDGEVFSAVNQTRVEFTEIPTEEIERMVASGEPMDKAGAYAIQGQAAKWISRIDGSYSAVMGLPIFELNQLLLQANFYQE